jgi:hypothetical protein
LRDTAAVIHLLDACDVRDHGAVLAGFDDHLRAAIAARGGGDVASVARVEAEVAADPARTIRFDATGAATVTAAGRSYQAGRFEVLRLCELRGRALVTRARAGRPTVRPRLWICDGASPATDIGALQASAAPGSLFQVASQFNCLESPGSFLTPVADYLHDPTQGPRASVSAFPATLVRHYAAPRADGSRFVQRDGEHDAAQIELLADVCDPGVARVRSGYLRASEIAEPAAFARALEDRFEAIAVGVQDLAEVVLGADWGGRVDGAPHRTIGQVLTSTIAGGMYGEIDDDPAGATICRQLQRAAYLGTLLAAAGLGKRRVVLTLIGGGVFANPTRVIWDAILWAADQIAPFLHRELSIVVNGRNLGNELPPAELRVAAETRGGALIRFAPSGAAFA